jgi:hypothetical protein
MNYVSAVLSMSIEITTPEVLPPELQALGVHTDEKGTHLPFSSKTELAAALSALQHAGFLFVDESAGWPPTAVFQQLRDEDFVNGVVRTVSWVRPSEPVIGEC